MTELRWQWLALRYRIQRGIVLRSSRRMKKAQARAQRLDDMLEEIEKDGE
jgi:hypothetical protein